MGPIIPVNLIAKAKIKTEFNQNFMNTIGEYLEDNKTWEWRTQTWT